jgi:hypothetical protein
VCVCVVLCCVCCVVLCVVSWRVVLFQNLMSGWTFRRAFWVSVCVCVCVVVVVVVIVVVVVVLFCVLSARRPLSEPDERLDLSQGLLGECVSVCVCVCVVVVVVVVVCVLLLLLLLLLLSLSVLCCVVCRRVVLFQNLMSGWIFRRAFWVS